MCPSHEGTLGAPGDFPRGVPSSTGILICRGQQADFPCSNKNHGYKHNIVIICNNDISENNDNSREPYDMRLSYFSGWYLVVSNLCHCFFNHAWDDWLK